MYLYIGGVLCLSFPTARSAPCSVGYISISHTLWYPHGICYSMCVPLVTGPVSPAGTGAVTRAGGSAVSATCCLPGDPRRAGTRLGSWLGTSGCPRGSIPSAGGRNSGQSPKKEATCTKMQTRVPFKAAITSSSCWCFPSHKLPEILIYGTKLRI